jgi:plasmid stability protein
MATTITLKNIPSGLYDQLKESATRHHRSINSEIIALMEETLSAKKMNPEDYLASARILREKTGRYQLKKAFIDRAKREGRA